MTRLFRLAAGGWNLLIAALLTLQLLSVALVAGWTYRLMQRETVRAWWRWSASPGKSATFEAFCAKDVDTAPLAERPRWLLAPASRRAADRARGVGRFRRAAWTLLYGLVRNATTGVQALFNTFVLTLPAGILWWLGWSSGWNNSFHKGYEQIFLGTAIAFAGVVWFCAVMLHVPLAQARQAATGDWRRFYDFRLVARLVQTRWPGVLLLACAYNLLAVPVSLLKVGPQFAWLANPDMAGWTDAELLRWLNGYYFLASLVGVGIYLILQVMAARVYARAVVAAIRRGTVSPGELASNERAVLDRLELATSAEPKRRPGIVVVAARMGSLGARTAATVALLVVWFMFSAQIFVTEFFAYHGARGWLNQPLVQAPWFRAVPPHLKDAG